MTVKYALRIVYNINEIFIGIASNTVSNLININSQDPLTPTNIYNKFSVVRTFLQYFQLF